MVLRRVVSWMVGSAAVWIAIGAQAAPPINDGIDSPTTATAQGVVFASNLEATLEPGEPGTLTGQPWAGTGTVWFRFVAPADGRYAISTLSSAIDTQLDVGLEASTVGSYNPFLAADDSYQGAQQYPVGPGRFNSQVLLTATEGTTYTIRVAESAGKSRGSFLLRVQGDYEDAGAGAAGLDDGSAWKPLGQEGAIFDSLNLGSRSHSTATQSLQATVNQAQRTRVIGFIEDAELDLPYAAIGPDRFVRAKYGIVYSGVGDSNSPLLSNRVPNFRLSLRTKGVVNHTLEVNHNVGISDPENLNIARELGPSKSVTSPSLYRVDLDPVDVPYLANSTSEGVQRGFEAVADLPDYTYVAGTIALVESTIGTYPALPRSAPAIKTYRAEPDSQDFTSSSLVIARLGFNRDQILRYLSGSLSPFEYYAPDIITVNVVDGSTTVTLSDLNGVTVNTVGVSTNRIGLVAVDFATGTEEDGVNLAGRARVSRGIQHMVSYRVKAFQQSNTVPYLRFRARAAKFAWAHKLEINGARAVGSSDWQTFAQQVLPGVGNQAAGQTTGDGTTYNLIFTSPLDPEIRADNPSYVSLLGQQPGPGINQPSRRDLLVGFDVADSLSYASGFENERAQNLQLNRIEIREYDQVPD